MVDLNTKLHVPNSNGSLVVYVKLTAKGKCRTMAMLLFYVLHKNTCTKVVYFLEIYYYASGQDFIYKWR
jgi:hypothetical protein